MALFSQRSASQAGSAQIPLSPRGLSSEGTPVPATAGGEMPPDKEVTRQLEDVMNMMSMYFFVYARYASGIARVYAPSLRPDAVGHRTVE